MKISKKIISWVLALAMILALLPLNAFAADDDVVIWNSGSQVGLQAKLNEVAASGGGTVRITKAFNLTIAITIPSGVLLEINDPTAVFNHQSNKGGFITVEENAGLLILSKIDVNSGGPGNDTWGFINNGFIALVGSSSALVCKIAGKRVGCRMTSDH